MANGPNVGGGQNIADITGGIGELLKGFVQGHQLRAADQEAQADAQTKKAKLGEDIADRFRTQLRDRPDLAANPNYTKIVMNASKQYGFQVPVDQASGGIDVNAFAPKPSIGSVLQDPKGNSAFYADTPEQRKQSYGKSYDTTGYEDAINAPQVTPYSPEIATKSLGAIQNAMVSLEAGKPTIAQVDAQIKAAIPKGYEGYFDVDSIINGNPALLAKMSAVAQANYDNLVSKGILTKAEAAQKSAEATTLPGLRAAQEKHYAQEDITHLKDVTAKIAAENQTNVTRARAVDASLARINASLSIADTQHRDRVAGQNLTHEDRQAEMAVRLATARGEDPVKRAQADVTAIKDYVGTLETQRKQLVDEAKGFQSRTQDVPKDITDQIDALDKQIGDYNGKLKSATDAVTKLPAAVEQQKLVKAGVSGLKPIDQGLGSGDATSFTPQLDAAKSIPKSQRISVLMQSSFYKSLSGSDRAAFVKQLQALP